MQHPDSQIDMPEQSGLLVENVPIVAGQESACVFAEQTFESRLTQQPNEYTDVEKNNTKNTEYKYNENLTIYTVFHSKYKFIFI
jgi:hypothetical protein